MPFSLLPRVWRRHAACHLPVKLILLMAYSILLKTYELLLCSCLPGVTRSSLSGSTKNAALYVEYKKFVEGKKFVECKNYTPIIINSRIIIL